MSAVFVGEAVAIADVESTSAPRLPRLRRRVTFRVERSFRGPDVDEIVVHTGMGGGDCGYSFMRGQKYLVFASDWDGGLNVSACGPTQPLSAAGRALAYLTQPPPADGGRIYGTVQFRSGQEAPKPASKYTVTLRGEQQDRTTKTNDSGEYEFRGLPVGTYSISVDVPDNMTASTLEKVDLQNVGGCVFRDLTVSPNGRIVTNVAVTGGLLAEKLELELIDVSTLNRPYVQNYYPDAEEIPPSGIVEWRALPPGRYVLGVNITLPATKENPYPPTFFPGVRDLSAAQIIELGFGQRVELPPFTLPEPPPMLTIRGSIQHADSRPVPGISVFLDSAEPHSLDRQVTSVQADRDGRFAIPAPAGSRYRLYVRWNQMRAVSEPFELTAATTPIVLVLR